MKTPLVLCIVCTLVVLAVSGTAEQKLKNCNEVRAAYSSKGFNVNDVPNKGVNGEFVNILACMPVLTSNTVVQSTVSRSWGRGPPWFLEGSPGGPEANGKLAPLASIMWDCLMASEIYSEVFVILLFASLKQQGLPIILSHNTFHTFQVVFMKTKSFQM